MKQHASLEAPAIDMESFRPFWKVRSRIDKLLVSGDITGFEWRCANEFRNLYDRALGSQLKASCLDGTGRGSGYQPNLQPHEQQFATLFRLRDLQGGLDRKTVQLLEAVIVDELSWCELGRRLRVHACTAKRRALAALRQLAHLG